MAAFTPALTPEVPLVESEHDTSVWARRLAEGHHGSFYFAYAPKYSSGTIGDREVENRWEKLARLHRLRYPGPQDFIKQAFMELVGEDSTYASMCLTAERVGIMRFEMWVQEEFARFLHRDLTRNPDGFNPHPDPEVEERISDLYDILRTGTFAVSGW